MGIFVLIKVGIHYYNKEIVNLECYAFLPTISS